MLSSFVKPLLKVEVTKFVRYSIGDHREALVRWYKWVNTRGNCGDKNGLESPSSNLTIYLNVERDNTSQRRLKVLQERKARHCSSYLLTVTGSMQQLPQPNSISESYKSLWSTEISNNIADAQSSSPKTRKFASVTSTSRN